MKPIPNRNNFEVSWKSAGMSRLSFEINQQHPEDEVLVLGSQVEETLALSIQTLQERNTKQAMHLIANNRHISQKCGMIETDTLSLLDTEWSTDRDLYILASIMEIALELKHIYGYASSIAEINLKLGTASLFNPFSDLMYLANVTRDMLHKALKAFADKDLDLTLLVLKQYSEADGLYQRIHRTLLSAVKADQTTISQASYLSHGGLQLVHIAGRATNICEWVVFSITGKMEKLKVD